MLPEVMGVANYDCPCALVKTDSGGMDADKHTKGFINPDEWVHAHRNAGMFYLKGFEEVFTAHVEYYWRKNQVLRSSS